MAQLENVLYTAKDHTTGGPDCGISHSSDDRLDIRLSIPSIAGTINDSNQLSASGWSACSVR